MEMPDINLAHADLNKYQARRNEKNSGGGYEL